MNGFVSDTGNAQIDALLTKGGLMSMMWVISLIIIALAFGGALEKTGSLETIVRELLGRLQGRAQLITGALLTTFGFNLASNAFVAYTIAGRLFADAFAAESLAPAALSRVMEDGATMSAPLIPWNSGGAFVSGALGFPHSLTRHLLLRTGWLRCSVYCGPGPASSFLLWMIRRARSLRQSTTDCFDAAEIINGTWHS